MEFGSEINAICWGYHLNQFADNHIVALGSYLAVLNLVKRNISKEMVIVYFDAYLNRLLSVKTATYIISRFIASEGTRKQGWYFKTKQTTPCKYLTTQKLMNRESIWGQMWKFKLLLLFLMPMSTLPIISTERKSQ